MPHRLYRSHTASVRAQRIDRLMLPAVTALLLLGAVFVLSAWQQAAESVQASQRKDEVRADRLAASVDELLDRRIVELSRWSKGPVALLGPEQHAELQRHLDEHLESGGAATVAWLVVGLDGEVLATGETTPGRIEANGIGDDLRALGRRVAAGDHAKVSGRLKLGEDYVFAVAYPLEGATRYAGQPAAVITVVNLQLTSFSAFLEPIGDDSADQVSLVDSRHQVLVGNRRLMGDLVHRRVGDSGWAIEYTRDPVPGLLPSWSYPGFALLLAAFAIAYALQDRNRRRLRELGDSRAQQVHALYELAARVLQSRSIATQAADLASTALDLTPIEGATVHVESADGEVVHSVGETGRGTAKYRVPIIGPREPLGELIVSRHGDPLSEEESWVLQTAATLAGAAMHTIVSLETERAAKVELERLDELRSNLLATVAHELLSPLTAVKGVLQLMSMQEDLGERGREYVEVATERTDRLVALIRDLFDCSLLETGQLDIRPKRQRADELLDSALGAQAAARGGELRLSATPNLMITVDPVRFDQLVNNLVTNAFRHGDAPVEVAVRPADNGALVIVSDEGPGIPEEDRDEIFGKFWQGSSGHARKYQGAGLGLSLVQGLVRVHGGDIRVDSTRADGRGARFTAFFPDTPPVQDAPPAADPADEAPSLV
jgi:signal transduction histidine kinase